MPSQTTTQENSAYGVIPAAPWCPQAVTVLPEPLSFKDSYQGIEDSAAIKTSKQLGNCAPLADMEYFNQVRLELGVLTWPNGADLDPGWLNEALADKKLWSVPF